MSNYGNATILKDKLNQYKQDLLSLLSDWHYLTNILHPQIMFTYQNIFGDLETELQNKSKYLAEIEKKNEIISSKVRKGEYISSDTLKIIETIAKNKVQEELSDKKNKMFSITEKSNHIFNCDINDDYELPQVYRALVKMLHPDRNGETDLYKNYWQQIQEAYRIKDVERLRLFYQLLSNHQPKRENPLLSYNSLETEIRQLKNNIFREKNRISRLKRQEPFCFEDKLNDSLWITRRKKLLRDRLYNLNIKIKNQKRIFNRLSTNPHTFRASSLKSPEFSKVV